MEKQLQELKELNAAYIAAIKDILASGHNLTHAIHDKSWERVQGETLQNFELSLKWLSESIGKTFTPHRLSTLNILQTKTP